ncbi:hypothetical protein HPB50_000980 [Hyalomma asiaticum]|uniref:Uncharacterized protein n=1 Tax=Hyalomma asiaticum TaxID=266040 RepID=A0ACB7TB70_HYAAI|nr:hypothetical protein HPB50_000980 [Hyalomma asiaticum]
MSKLSRHSSKRRRRSEGYYTPPSELPAAALETSSDGNAQRSTRPPDQQPQTSSAMQEMALMSSPWQSPASPQTYDAAFSAIAPSYLASPSDSPPPLVTLLVSTSTGASRRSSTHSSSRSATLPASLSANRTSRSSVYPKPTVSAARLGSLSETFLSSEQRTLSAGSLTSERHLNSRPSYPAVVKHNTLQNELVPLQTQPSNVLSSSWTARARQLLGRFCSLSANSSRDVFRRYAQQNRTRIPEAIVLPPCDLGEQPPGSSSASRQQSLPNESVQSVTRSAQSQSRTSLSLPQDASSVPPPTVANSKMASCLRREEASLLVGRRGAFQTTTFHFGLLVAFMMPFQTLPVQIDQHDTDHWCARPKNLRNMSTEEWKRQMVPRTENGDYSRCRMYAEWNATDVATVPCTSWEYAPSAYHYSIVEEFGLVCELGAICALLITGPLADWLGRKTVMQFTVMVLQAAVGVILLFVMLNTFIIMRFLLGASTATLFNTSFVLVVEVLAPERRTLYAMAVLLSKVVGTIIASTMMMARFSWYTLHLGSMLLSLMMLRTVAGLTESPRWLLARGRLEEAETVIMHAATLNGENLFDVRRQWARQRRELEHRDSIPQGNFCEATRSRSRWRYSGILYFCWSVTAFTLQATWLKIHNLGFYPTALVTLFALLSVPGELGAMASAAHIGRKTSLSWALVIAAIALFGAAAWGDANVVSSVTLLTLANVGTDASQAVLTLYTAEVYPTVMRCSGLATCTCFSAAASIAAPVAVHLGFLRASWLALVVVSLLGIAAAFLAIRLPDIKECAVLPDELSDVPFEAAPGNPQPVPDNTNVPSPDIQSSDKRRTLGQR